MLTMPLDPQSLGMRGVSMDMESSWAANGDSTLSIANLARFQQKQLQEKEQKLLQLYDQQQQRAYNVSIRGSAGSTDSNGGTTMSQQQIVTKTTSTSVHSSSSNQGGKVRQMFDERRQTTVKGIDRGNPLEPLDNKSKKHQQGAAVGNNSVTRQSVTVKKSTRTEVNSNVNGGKPHVIYHAQVTKESLSPNGHHEYSTKRFNNVNDFQSYNGNDPDHKIRIEEITDDDAIDSNGIGEALKYHMKNDLESEEFPEDLLINDLDKHPRRAPAKKLTQAEARLERFKNTNAKRNNAGKAAASSTKASIKKKIESTSSIGSNPRAPVMKRPRLASSDKENAASNREVGECSETTRRVNNSRVVESRGSLSGKRSATSKGGNVASIDDKRKQRGASSISVNGTNEIKRSCARAAGEYHHKTTTATTRQVKQTRIAKKAKAVKTDLSPDEKNSANEPTKTDEVSSEVVEECKVVDEKREQPPPPPPRTDSPLRSTSLVKQIVNSTVSSNNEESIVETGESSHQDNVSSIESELSDNDVDRQEIIMTDHRINVEKQESTVSTNEESNQSTEEIVIRQEVLVESTDSDYNRTDSVESALRRFDSIGNDTDKSSPESVKVKSDDNNQEKNESNSDSPVPSTGKVLTKIEKTRINKSKEDVKVASKSPTCKRRLFASPLAGSKQVRLEAEKELMAAATSDESMIRGKPAAAAKSIEARQDCKGRASPAMKLLASIDVIRDATRSKTTTRGNKKFREAKRKISRRAPENVDVGGGDGTSSTVTSASAAEIVITSCSSESTKSKEVEAASPGGESSGGKSIRSAGKSTALGLINDYDGRITAPGSSSISTTKKNYLRSTISRDCHVRKSCAHTSVRIGVKVKDRKSPRSSPNLDDGKSIIIAGGKENCIVGDDDSKVTAESNNDDSGRNIDDGKVLGASMSKLLSKSDNKSEQQVANGSVIVVVKNVTSNVARKSPSPDFAMQKHADYSSSTRTTGASTRKSFPLSMTKNSEIKIASTKSPGYNGDGKVSSDAFKLELLNGAAEVKSEPTPPRINGAFVIEFDDKEEGKENERNIGKQSYEKSSATQKHQRHSSSSGNSRPTSSLSNSSSGATSAASRSHGSTKATAIMATKTKAARATTVNKSQKPSAPLLASDQLVRCKVCERNFAQDRISLHEQICKKTTQKRRKQYDISAHRLQGTELEGFATTKAPNKRASERNATQKKAPAKSNWRKKHEDFINAIRSAKEMQAHLAAGGKLSDLPPPPPSDTSDYVQCPHCKRKFNNGAAERHIPKCKDMMHNKPNPRAPPKPKR